MLKKHSFNGFDEDEFALFRRKSSLEEIKYEYELRWRNGNKKVLTYKLLNEFAKYIKNHAHKEPKESGYAQLFLEDFRAFKEDEKNGTKFDNEYFELWAKLYIFVRGLPNVYRKFLGLRNASSFKKRESNGDNVKEKKKRKQKYHFNGFSVQAAPNARSSYIMYKDNRHDLNFDFIEDLNCYLQNHAKQTPDLKAFKLAVLNATFEINSLCNSPYDKKIQVDFWKNFNALLTDNKKTANKYKDWKKKVNKRTKIAKIHV